MARPVTEGEIEDVFDAIIIDTLLGADPPAITMEHIAMIAGIGWTDLGGYYGMRLEQLRFFGFLSGDRLLSPKIQTAFDQGLFKTGAELFNPTPEQRLLLKMWDITPAKVEN